MNKETSNLFLETLRKGIEENWCIKPYCTTCGAIDFRMALRPDFEQGVPLLNALANVNLIELTSLPKWEDAIEIAVRDLALPGQVTSLLESWLARADENIRFFDFVLYKLVRYLPEEQPVRVQWIEKAIAIAIKTEDFSLVESIILTLRGKALQYTQVMFLAEQFATKSKQMRRVLLNACNIDVKLA